MFLYCVFFRVSVDVKCFGCFNDVCSIINREFVVGVLYKVISNLCVFGGIGIGGLIMSDK